MTSTLTVTCLRDEWDRLRAQARLARPDAERDQIAAELQAVEERMTWLVDTHIG